MQVMAAGKFRFFVHNSKKTNVGRTSGSITGCAMKRIVLAIVLAVVVAPSAGLLSSCASVEPPPLPPPPPPPPPDPPPEMPPQFDIKVTRELCRTSNDPVILDACAEQGWGAVPVTIGGGGSVNVAPPRSGQLQGTVQAVASASSQSLRNESVSRSVNLVECEIFDRQQISERDCREAERQNSAIEAGIAGLNYDKTMYVNPKTPYPVTLLLGAKADSTLEIETAPSDNQVTQTISGFQLSDFIAIELTGDGFTIEPRGDVQKRLVGDRQESWRWMVSPTVTGKRRLEVKIKTKICIEGRCVEKNKKPKYYPVEVVVRPKPISESILGGLSTLQKILVALAAVVTAAAGLWAALRKFKQS